MSGKVLIFSAPSGSGKTTIVKYLVERDLNLEFSISATSRKPRGDEVDGKEYYFLTAEEFTSKIKAGELIEWEEVYKDHYYGTLKREIDRIWQNGNHAIFDVDVMGGINLKRIFGQQALSVFIRPPSIEVLRERLEKRATETPDKIEMRIAKARDEMEKASVFDHVIVNDNLDRASVEAEELVRKFINNTLKL